MDELNSIVNLFYAFINLPIDKYLYCFYNSIIP